MEQNNREIFYYLDHFNFDIHATLMRTGEANEAKFADFADTSTLVNIAAACTIDEPNFVEMDTSWFIEWLKSGKIIISEMDGEITGFCCVGRYADVVWIRSLAVLPSKRRMGYGKKMLLQALRYGCDTGAKRAFLHVEKDNQGAITLYNKMDFTATGGSEIVTRKRETT